MSATREAGIKGILRRPPKRTRHRHAVQPSPTGNRHERRAWDAMRREAERENKAINASRRTSEVLKLILSGESTYAYKDKRP